MKALIGSSKWIVYLKRASGWCELVDTTFELVQERTTRNDSREVGNPR